MKSNHHKGSFEDTGLHSYPPQPNNVLLHPLPLPDELTCYVQLEGIPYTPGHFLSLPFGWFFSRPQVYPTPMSALPNTLKEGPPVSWVLPWGSSLPLCLVNHLFDSSRSRLQWSAEPGRFCPPGIMAWESSQGSSLGYLKTRFFQFSAFWNSMVCCLKPSVFKRAVIFSLDFECLWQKGKLDLCSLLSRSRRLVNTLFKYTDNVQWLTKDD